MYDNIKEIYVGVVVTKTREGKEVSTPLYRAGRPVACDVYTPDHLPPKTTWEDLCRWALREHVDGHGVTIFYVDGRERREERKVIDDAQGDTAKQREFQALIAADFVAGRVPDEDKHREKVYGKQAPKVTPKPAEVIING